MSEIVSNKLTPVHHGHGQLVVGIVDILDDAADGIDRW